MWRDDGAVPLARSPFRHPPARRSRDRGTQRRRRRSSIARSRPRSARGRFALLRAAGSPGLRRYAACRRITKGKWMRAAWERVARGVSSTTSTRSANRACSRSSASHVTLGLDPRVGGQIASRALVRQPARHLVRVHEPERLRALAQEAVDEGGLPGAVQAGEENEGGHAHNNSMEPAFSFPR